MELANAIPADLREQIGDASWARISSGKSGAIAFLLSSNEGSFFLKATSISAAADCREELRREYEVLQWLQSASFEFSPKPLYFGTSKTHGFLLTTEVPGRDLEATLLSRAIVIECARLLRVLHGISIRGCTLDQRLNAKLKAAHRRVEAGLVDEQDFDAERAGKSAEEVFSELIAKRPKKEDLVFTHGDFTPANILFDSQKPSGLVDWGKAGIADRCQDLALFCRSLPSVALVQLFLSSYGIRDYDSIPMGYYAALDELF